MACIDYNADQEQAHYHFALGEIVYYISQYGIDPVMTDIYDLLSKECNTRIAKHELEAIR